MKKLILVLCAGLLLISAAAAQDVNAPIKQLLNAFNTSDAAAIKAAYAAGDISITDEFPPFHWSGPNANDTWMADLATFSKANGSSAAHIGFSDPIRTEVDGDSAYVVVPTIYTWKQNGKTMAENAEMTFVLHKESSGWKITGWTWSGQKPHAK